MDHEEKILPDSETRFKDLSGIISASFKQGEDLNKIASLIPGFDPGTRQAIAVRIYYETHPVLTVYAVDKVRDNLHETDRTPVRKYKVDITDEDLLNMFHGFNFTMVTGDVDISRMQVINK